MKLVVIIPTFGRKHQTARLVGHLFRETRLPDEVIISAPDATHVAHIDLAPFPISYIFGKAGLSAQRNNALAAALGRFEIITFFDDDFLPAINYLECIDAAFAAHPTWAVVMGRVIADGAQGPGLDWNEGTTILDSHVDDPRHFEPIDHVGAYGCNMSIRADCIRDLRFDERLALYGWQEDIDFTSQLRKKGRVVGLHAPVGVHLGLKMGRVSGDRFGYSQVINPIYLIRKGSVPALFAIRLLIRNVLANILGSLWPEPYIDRRGRLRGNLLAALHAMLGRIEPEFILSLRDGPLVKSP